MNNLKTKVCVFVLLVLALTFPIASFAIYIPNPDNIEVEGLVSFGEDGAAWLSWKGHEILVTSGYMIGRDLRVVAVRHDSVVLYSPKAKQYHVLVPKVSLAHKDRSDVIWTKPMLIWKITRMVGLAYRKDYICNYLTTSQNMVRRHMRNMEDMMGAVVSPNHRFYGKNGIIYVSPVHFQGTGWRFLMNRIQNFRSRTLGDWFAKLNSNGTIISDGKPLDQVLQNISFKTGVRIIWSHPIKLPLFCSLRDRPWSEIIANIVIFNGLSVTPTSEGLVVK